MNNYFLESSDYELIKGEIEKIIDKEGFTDSYISKYDMSDDSLISSLFESLYQISLFSDKKTIILENIEAIKDNKLIDELLNYLKKPIENNLVIITTKNIDKKLLIYKNLKKLTNYYEIKMDGVIYIKNNLDGYSASINTINLLNEYCNNDISRLKNELNKLKLYKEDKIILEEDIKLLVKKTYKDNTLLTFDFIKILSTKNRKNSLKKYRELLNYDLIPHVLLSLIATNFRSILQVKILEKHNLSDKEIGDKLFKTSKNSDYRAKKIRELTVNYTQEELYNILIDLADIDKLSKTTNIDLLQEIELFIIKNTE